MRPRTSHRTCVNASLIQARLLSFGRKPAGTRRTRRGSTGLVGHPFDQLHERPTLASALCTRRAPQANIAFKCRHVVTSHLSRCLCKRCACHCFSRLMKWTLTERLALILFQTLLSRFASFDSLSGSISNVFLFVVERGVPAVSILAQSQSFSSYTFLILQQ